MRAAVLLFGLVFVLATNAGGEVETGQVKLQFAGAFDDDKITKVEMGQNIKLEARLRAGDFMGMTAAFANARVENTADVPMYYAYFVAFFDEDGVLVATTAQSSTKEMPLEPGKRTSLGSSFARVPKEDIERIASYQIRFLESETPLGE